MKKGDINLFNIASILLLLVGCTSPDNSSSFIDSSVEESISSEEVHYVVEYVLFDKQVIREIYVDGEVNQYPQVEESITDDNTDYCFEGWDYTNDGIVDEDNFMVHADVTCYAIYKVAPQITIDYSCDGEDKSITIGNNELFTLEVPTEKENFLYYMDENGYPYTDKEGNKLKSVDLRKSITLMPFFLEKENLPCQVYVTTYPSLRVKGEEEQRLLKAIEENRVSVSEFDENKITFDGVDYQKVITQNKGNIFRDYTKCEYGETYYFRYTPLKWDIYDFAFDREEIVYSGSTSDIVNYHNPQIKEEMDFLGDRKIYVEATESNVLQHQIRGFYMLDISSIRMIYARVPRENLIIDKVKVASDYVIASMPIEISYEKGTMFHICYSIGDVVDNLSKTEDVYIYNYQGDKEKVKSGPYYGELLEYKFSA